MILFIHYVVLFFFFCFLFLEEYIKKEEHIKNKTHNKLVQSCKASKPVSPEYNYNI